MQLQADLPAHKFCKKGHLRLRWSFAYISFPKRRRGTADLHRDTYSVQPLITRYLLEILVRVWQVLLLVTIRNEVSCPRAQLLTVTKPPAWIFRPTPLPDACHVLLQGAMATYVSLRSNCSTGSLARKKNPPHFQILV